MFGQDPEENRQERAYFLSTYRPRGSMLAPSRPTIPRLQEVVSKLIASSGCEPEELGVSVSAKLSKMVHRRFAGSVDAEKNAAKIRMPDGREYELSMEDVSELKNVIEKLYLDGDVAESWRVQRNRYRADLFKTLQVAEKHGISADRIGVKVNDLRFALHKVYQNPNTLETWSGKGVKPKWAREWIEKGGSLEALLISE